MVTQRPGSWTKTMTFHRSWSVSPFSGQFQGKHVMILVERFSLRWGSDWKRRQLTALWVNRLYFSRKGLAFMFWGFSFEEVSLHASGVCAFVTQSYLFATPWTAAIQASLSMGFSRQEYWSGLLFPSPGHLPDPGIKPRSPALQADSLLSKPPGMLLTSHLLFSLGNMFTAFLYICLKCGSHICS